MGRDQHDPGMTTSHPRQVTCSHSRLTALVTYSRLAVRKAFFVDFPAEAPTGGDQLINYSNRPSSSTSRSICSAVCVAKMAMRKAPPAGVLL